MQEIKIGSKVTFDDGTQHIVVSKATIDNVNYYFLHLYDVNQLQVDLSKNDEYYNEILEDLDEPEITDEDLTDENSIIEETHDHGFYYEQGEELIYINDLRVIKKICMQLLKNATAFYNEYVINNVEVGEWLCQQ